MARTKNHNADSLQRYPVLIVDDEPLNLEAFTFNFGREFTVYTANDAAEARQRLEEGGVAVVIADHRMPGESGLDFLSWVAEAHPNVVRILLTAFYEVDLLQDALNRGILFRFAKKPWRFATLRQDVLLAIQQRRELIEKEQAGRALMRENLLRGVGIASRYTLETLVPQFERLDSVLTRARKRKKVDVDDLLDNLGAILDDVRDQLTTMRGSVERLSSPPSPLDLQAVGQALVAALSPAAAARGVTLRLSAASNTPVWASVTDVMPLETGLRSVVEAWVERAAASQGNTLVIELGETEDGSVHITVEEHLHDPSSPSKIEPADEALHRVTAELKALILTLQGVVETSTVHEPRRRLAVVLPAAAEPISRTAP